MESGSKGRKLMNKYRTTWTEIYQQMNEAQSHTVRYTDPLNKKRFAIPYKTHADAEKKMAQLKKDGVKDINITMDTLKPGVSFKEELDKDDEKDIEKVISKLNKASDAHAGQAKTLTKALKEDGHTDVSSSKRMAQVISEDAQLIIKELNKKSDEDELPTWWTNKLAVSAHNMNAARDYITNDIKESNEEVEIKEAMSDAQLKKVRDSYKDLKTISPEKVKTLKNFLDRYSTDSLMQLAQANINFVSTMARSVMNKRKFNDPKHAGSMKEGAAEDMEKVAKLRTQQMMIQTKVQKMDKADPKNKTPLAIAKNDLDNIQMRMSQLKQRAEREKTRPQIAAEKEPEKNKEEIKERIEGLENKSDKSGIQYGILKQVYDRGMAAWKGGHRPGTTPQQWAFARVNSFITKGKTYHTADADLAKKARN